MRRSTYILVALTILETGATARHARADASPTAFAGVTDSRLSTIRYLIESRDYPAALELAGRVTTEKPELADGWMLLGYLDTVTSRFEASNAAYDEALKRGADPAAVLSAKAYNCRRLGDAQKTRECLQDIVDIDKTNAGAWIQLASFEASVDNDELAVQYYTRAISLDAENIDALEAVARVEEKRGNITQATAWLESGLARDPGSVRLLKRLSVITLNAQDYGRAVGYCDRALAVDPGDVTVQRNRAVALYQKGDKKEAIDSFETLRDLGGKMDGLYGPLADCYHAAGRDVDALKVIGEGIAADSQPAWLYSLWGKILEGRRQFDEAIAKFDRAVAANDELWSDYARKQIARQNQLKKREAMIARQGEM
jgi:tetratricopeptide (TPR) repeat protein